MKQADELAQKLRPFIDGERNTCFSEIHGLLCEILEYLENTKQPSANTVVDPTIKDQMELPFEGPPPCVSEEN